MPIMIDSEARYTEREASELLGVSRVTLWKMRRDGEIEFMPWLKRSIRYRGAHLLAYIARAEHHQLRRAAGGRG